MAADTAVANNKQAPSGRTAAQAPPAGAFWKRYSPHHEFPLSLSSSLFLHILGFVLLGGFLLAFLGLNQNKELPVGVVVVAGGGGNPNGLDNKNPGDAALASKEATPNKEKSSPETVASNTQLIKPEAKKPELTLPEKGVRPIEADTGASDSKLSATADKARQALSGLLAGKGEGGPGSGGGKGKGKGTGTGDAEGPGKGNLSQREKRQLRWTMIFNTRNGEDYADQLQGLGAILAIPGPNGEYLVIRDLDRRHRPVQPKQEDLKGLNRIYWVDDKPQSVQSLAMALGIRPVPDHVVAFFPQELEKELAEKELRYRNRREEDITETTFKVDRRGGRYEPVVTDQRVR